MSKSGQRSALIEMEVEACSPLDKPKLTLALAEIAQNDPSISAIVDPENGATVVGADSEVELDSALAKLKQQGIAIKFGNPKVSYRETITRRVTKDYTHKKVVGRTGHYARVVFEIWPKELDEGNSFEMRLTDDPLPSSFVAGVKKGLQSVLASGPIAGFPIVDLGMILNGSGYHDTDSSPIAFEIATRAALREAFDSADAVLLEPVMKVDITLPSQCIDLVISDLHSRRGQVMSTSENGEMNTMSVLVPLANMFGYGTKLNALSDGAANFKMEYSHYQAISPPDGPDSFPPAIGMRI